MIGWPNSLREISNTQHKKIPQFLYVLIYLNLCCICNNFIGNFLERLCCEKRGEISGFKNNRGKRALLHFAKNLK